MTHTLAVANQKGGVAKTTTVASLGAALAEQGQRVLLVDLDPQACLTFSLGLDPEALELSVHDVLLGRVSAAMAVQATDDGVDLLPSTIDLAGSEAMLLTRTGREYALRTALEAWLGLVGSGDEHERATGDGCGVCRRGNGEREALRRERCRAARERCEKYGRDTHVVLSARCGGRRNGGGEAFPSKRSRCAGACISHPS